MSIVPNVVGLSNFNADTATGAGGLKRRNCDASDRSHRACRDVISESPTAGTCAVQGSNVDVIVSAGPDMSVVPNVVGLSLAAAKAKITAASLAVATLTQESSATVPAGNVISQSPVAGTIVLQQTSVNLVVSTGPAPVNVPNVVSKSGVNFVIFVQICPKIDICSQNLCSSWSNFTKVTSAFQRFQPVNSTQYLLGLLRNEGRVD
jgi:beta-lactam-binding protein with PASTA domain